MHIPAVPHPFVLGQDRAGWDEESLLSPGAGSGSHPCQLSSVLLPGMAPSQNPVCLPTATRSHSPGHRASAGAWRCLLPGRHCQRGCYSHPHPRSSGASLCCVPSCPD